MSEWVDSGGISARRIGGREIAVVRGLGGRWEPGNHATRDEAKRAAEDALAEVLIAGLLDLGRLPDVAAIERERDEALAEVERLRGHGLRGRVIEDFCVADDDDRCLEHGAGDEACDFAKRDEP